MKTNTVGNIAKTLNLKKLAKPAVLCISAILAICMVSTFSFSGVHAATTMLPVTTSGNQIIDSNGNVVYLRGVGMAGMSPDLIFWGSGGGDSWADQWQSASATSVTDTFAEMQSVWHVNMIRIFVYPEWWYLNGQSGTANGENVQTYLATLASEAEQYGIYIDIVPYQLTAYQGSFSSDPYLSSNMAGSQGLPLMNDWDTAANSFLASTGLSEQAFWTSFWTSMANGLKAYPNVIFEAWNEPGDNSGGNTIPSGYLSYLTTMYNAVRSAGSTNLIMMQWQPGWEPNGWGQNLSWASQINTALGGSPSNMVYTTHFYYYAPSNLASYWNDPSQFEGATSLANCLQLLQASMGVNAPLVINEEGSCLSSSSNAQNDYTWFGNVLQAQNTDGIGAGAYYWLSSSGLGGTYDGEDLLTSGYSANTMGQDFINAYTAPTVAALTPTPTAAPTPTATPTPMPTATPTPALAPIPAPSTIVASAGIGGSISPSGSISIDNGNNQTYTITADTGYQISDVSVNGVSVGAVATYTINAAQDSYTIAASFAANPPPVEPAQPTAPIVPSSSSITASAGEGGSISPTGTISVTDGDNQTFAITANTGYQISDVTVNGTSVGAVATYTLSNIQDSYTVTATFAPIQTPPTAPETQTLPISTPSPLPNPPTLTVTTPTHHSADHHRSNGARHHISHRSSQRHRTTMNWFGWVTIATTKRNAFR